MPTLPNLNGMVPETRAAFALTRPFPSIRTCICDSASRIAACLCTTWLLCCTSALQSVQVGDFGEGARRSCEDEVTSPSKPQEQVARTDAASPEQQQAQQQQQQQQQQVLEVAAEPPGIVCSAAPPAGQQGALLPPHQQPIGGQQLLRAAPPSRYHHHQLRPGEATTPQHQQLPGDMPVLQQHQLPVGAPTPRQQQLARNPQKPKQQQLPFKRCEGGLLCGGCRQQVRAARPWG